MEPNEKLDEQLKERLLNLADAVYKVSGLLPKEEPLVFLMREKAVEVIVDYLTSSKKILVNIDVLNSYFALAIKQNWINNDNFIILKAEYLRVKQSFGGAIKEEDNRKRGVKARVVANSIKDSKPKAVFDLNKLKERQRKIIKILEKKDKAQVKDLEMFFPGVSKRTLRRDMSYLFDLGYVRRQGDANNTLYRLV